MRAWGSAATADASRSVIAHGIHILERVQPSVHTGRNQTGEHTGDGGTVLGGKKQRILALPDEEFQSSLDQVVIQGGPGYL
jgi:hypothetical protein